jgi:hypothetical protein
MWGRWRGATCTGWCQKMAKGVMAGWAGGGWGRRTRGDGEGVTCDGWCQNMAMRTIDEMIRRIERGGMLDPHAHWIKIVWLNFFSIDLDRLGACRAGSAWGRRM